MQGAEKRRLRRIWLYAARRSERLPASGGLASLWLEGNAADDALMVDQG